MSSDRGAVFWSYAHDDDRFDTGRILQLATDIANEYSLITGRDLSLFIDRDIKWGEEWSSRIADALIETTFFIAIMTPRYFAREECRKEFSAFHAQAESLGLGELLLPIMYIDITDFGGDNPDPLIATASKYQYIPWSDVRLSDCSSDRYRNSVHLVATRLVENSRTVISRQLASEVAEASESANNPASGHGWVEIREDLDRLLPPWLRSIESNDVGREQYQATAKFFASQLSRFAKNAQGGLGQQHFSILQRKAQESLPFAERELRDAEEYHRITIELEPVILRIFRLLEHEPSGYRGIQELRDALRVAKSHIDDRHQRAPGEIRASIWWERHANISRLAREVAAKFRSAESEITATNAVVSDWITQWNSAITENDDSDWSVR